MALISLEITWSDGSPITITAEQVSAHFAISPTLTARQDGTLTFADHGRSLTHIPTGLLITRSGWLDLRRYAAELEALPINWATLTHASELTEEQAKQAKAVSDRLIAEDDTSWPWPEWAGDKSQPALSLLTERLDFALKFTQRYDFVTTVTNSLRTDHPELARIVDTHLLGSLIASHSAGYGLIYLLSVLQRIDPTAADRAARNLVGAWEDGSSMDEWMYQWRKEIAEGVPLTLHEFPDLPLLEKTAS
ncbi:hypothetical protein [Nocardia pseudovaccinii]|uniref:hypothetical protein n=1 Tax=Nocardia pseudovaccinii TaxID=189540 RepID=UPI0007A4AF24|nr:hypothetical protein [Nocardia pseudovaccinii]